MEANKNRKEDQKNLLMIKDQDLLVKEATIKVKNFLTNLATFDSVRNITGGLGAAKRFNLKLSAQDIGND